MLRRGDGHEEKGERSAWTRRHCSRLGGRFGRTRFGRTNQRRFRLTSISFAYCFSQDRFVDEGRLAIFAPRFERQGRGVFARHLFAYGSTNEGLDRACVADGARFGIVTRFHCFVGAGATVEGVEVFFGGQKTGREVGAYVRCCTCRESRRGRSFGRLSFRGRRAAASASDAEGTGEPDAEREMFPCL